MLDQGPIPLKNLKLSQLFLISIREVKIYLNFSNGNEWDVGWVKIFKKIESVACAY